MQGLGAAEVTSHARVAQAASRPRLSATLPAKATAVAKVAGISLARARAGTTARARTKAKAKAKVGRATAMGRAMRAAHHGSKARLSTLL